jgi:hypothetical protein
MRIRWQSFFVVLLFFLINAIISLIVSSAGLHFVDDNIHIMTDATSWDLPTKENIVSRLCRMSLLPSHFFFLVKSDASTSSWCSTPRLPFFLLYVIRPVQGSLTVFHTDSTSSFGIRPPDLWLEWSD